MALHNYRDILHVFVVWGEHGTPLSQYDVTMTPLLATNHMPQLGWMHAYVIPLCLCFIATPYVR